MKKIPLFVYPGLAIVLLSSLPSLHAQAPAATNLITNGGFERSFAQDNLWDGVDSTGALAGGRVSVEALAESGTFRAMAMPVSVATGDLNKDGLMDIMTADPYGYMRVYFNSGTKTAPAFTNAEAVGCFLSAAPADRRKIPRINLFDWSNRGMLDLTVGNYFGETFFIPNSGAATAPDFRQPPDMEKALVTTTKSTELWANLLAPAAYDFNKDGRVDLLMGEGSYSANAVHLLLNQGSNNAPKFDEANRSYLAYGDGRELLTPTIVDYNGDGQPDVLVSDREGKVGVYLNPGPNWKPAQEFKFSSFIKFGASESLGGLVTISAADFNGDGLFDLVIGKSNGRVVMALNTGTKTEPKFNTPVDVKGKDLWARDIKNPSGWQTELGLERGNTYAVATCVTVEEEKTLVPPEGKAVLKIGYAPSPNKILKMPTFIIPGIEGKPALTATIEFNAVNLPSNVFILRKSLPQLKVGANYTLSFKARGENVKNVNYTLGWSVSKDIAPSKKVAGDRGSVSIQRFTATEGKTIVGKISSGSSWSATTKSFTVDKLKDPNLQDVTKIPAVLEIRGTLAPTSGAVYFDDFQLVEK